MNNIEELCGNISLNKTYSQRNISKSKLNNVMANLCINNDQLVIFYDSSLFENGKNGLAICHGGIYWKDAFCTPRYLNWNDFRKLKLTHNKNNIYFGDKGSVFVYETEVESLICILKNLKTGLKVDNFVEKTAGILNFVDSTVNFLKEISNSINNNSNQSHVKNESRIMELSDTNMGISNSRVLIEEVQWMIATKDMQIGPYTTQEVRNWLDINNEKYERIFAWKKGMDQWELISNIQEFNYIQEQKTPPLPMLD